MSRQISLGMALALACSATALAADLPTPKGAPLYVPPPAFTWTGAYVGADLGYQWGTATTGVYSAPGGAFLAALPDYGARGIVGGAHAGYNYQIDQFVVGVEGDINGTSYAGSQNVAFGVANVSTHENVEGSVRGRFGYAWNRTLFYATGGSEIGSLQNTYSLVGTDNLSHTRIGWTVGGGLEYAITPNWSVRLGYRYTDYGHYNDLLTNSTGGVLQARVHETHNFAHIGFSYKFDSVPAPAAPLLGKY